MEWNWSENGVGSCESALQSNKPISVIALIPVIVSVVLVVICISLVALLVIERRKRSGQRNTLTRVAYNRDTGVEIVENQLNPATVILPSQYHDIELQDDQNVNPHQAEEYSDLGGGGVVVPFSVRGEQKMEALYSVPWQRSATEEDGVYNTLNPAQYHNERPRQTEDAEKGEEGEEGEGVYNTLDH